MGEEFDAGIQCVEVAEVDRSKAEGVVDECDEAAAFVTLTVCTENGVVGDLWVLC